MSTRTRTCPDCRGQWPQKTKVCLDPGCGYVWPARVARVKAPRAVRAAAPRSPTLAIRDLPPGAHLLEGDFQEPLKRALCASGRTTRVMRQNVGSVVTRNRAGLETGRFTAGAFEGAADLSGLVAPWGFRLEVEVKVDAPHQDNQKAFQAMITRFGGIYVLCRYDHALSLVDNVAAGVALVDSAISARVSALLAGLSSQVPSQSAA